MVLRAFFERELFHAAFGAKVLAWKNIVAAPGADGFVTKHIGRSAVSAERWAMLFGNALFAVGAVSPHFFHFSFYTRA
jgi:hypothetical protein